MRKKKRRGSSLIFVVFVAALIFTTGAALLTAVTADYKARVNASVQLKNLYAADSGIDLVKNVINKESEVAMVCASNLLAEDIQNNRLVYDVTTITKEDYNKINKRFKYYFIKALTSSSENLSDLSEPEVESQENLLYSIESLTYRYVKSRDTFSDESAYETYINNVQKCSKIINSDNVFIKSDCLRTDTEGSTAIIDASVKTSDKFNSIRDYNDTEKYTGDFTITIGVKSTFETDTSSDTTGKKLNNKKTISTKFTLEAPDYDKALITSARNLTVYDYDFIRAITADGNLNIDNLSTGSTVNGDIWIRGNESKFNNDTTNVEKIRSKYSNGILVNNSKITFNGDIMCGQAIALSSDSELNNSSEDGSNKLYANNIYVGPRTDDVTASKDNVISADKVIANNDLVINSSKTKVDIDEFYGANDRVNGETNSEDRKVKNIDITKAIRDSSSIIVNNASGDNTIKLGSAWINGISYLHLQGKDDNNTEYATGESIAIDGNYKAYADIAKADENPKLRLEYFSSYALLNSDNIEDKSEYFINYYSDSTNKNKLQTGGVTINNVYAYGAYVYKDASGNAKIDKNTLNTEQASKINAKKQEYARNVFLMQNDYKNLASISNVNSVGKDKYTGVELEGIYGNNTVIKSVLGGTGSVGVVNFDGYEKLIKDKYAEGSVEYNKYMQFASKRSILKPKLYGFLVNCIASDDVKITKDAVYIGDKKTDIEYSSDEKAICAVIITKGKVVIKDDVKFKGVIISGSDVSIGDNVTITCDKKDIDNSRYTISEMSELRDAFKTLCNNVVPNSEHNVSSAASLRTDKYIDESLDQKYLKEHLWKIEK